MADGARFSMLITPIDGDIISASNWIGEFQNILNNLDPSGLGSGYENTTEMQATSDPYPGDVASVPASLKIFLQQIVYVIKQITNQAQWYIDPTNFAHQSDQAVGSTSGPSTTSTSFVDLAEMSITMTTGANPVMIHFSGTFTINANVRTGTIILDIDGSDKAESERSVSESNSGFDFTLAFGWREVVTAASHTFKIQFKTNGDTITADTIRRSMQVIELK